MQKNAVDLLDCSFLIKKSITKSGGFYEIISNLKKSKILLSEFRLLLKPLTVIDLELNFLNIMTKFKKSSQLFS